MADTDVGYLWEAINKKELYVTAKSSPNSDLHFAFSGKVAGSLNSPFACRQYQVKKPSVRSDTHGGCLPYNNAWAHQLATHSPITASWEEGRRVTCSLIPRSTKYWASPGIWCSREGKYLQQRVQAIRSKCPS